MYFSRIILLLVFVLFASSALAAIPAKELVCHVGNEYGLEGEVYLDDPGCVPVEENDYFCPDAGKIDLIEVAKAARHLNNPSHTFEYAPGEFISDYRPADIGASGVGNEDTVGDGVDDGCRPPSGACPCSESWAASIQDWNTYIESPSVPSFLVGAALPGSLSFSTRPSQNHLARCLFEENKSSDDNATVFFLVRGPTSSFPNRCDNAIYGQVGGGQLPSPPKTSFWVGNLTPEQLTACVTELQSICQ